MAEITPNDTFEAKRKAAMEKPDTAITPAEAAAAVADARDDQVVNLHISYSGEMYAITKRGRIFKRAPDSKNFEPGGPHFAWFEISGPKF